MKLYLSRQWNGDYMLTSQKPIRNPVRGLSHDDLYINPGDPVGQRNFCGLIAQLAGIEMERLDSVRVDVTITPMEG